MSLSDDIDSITDTHNFSTLPYPVSVSGGIYDITYWFLESYSQLDDLVAGSYSTGYYTGTSFDATSGGVPTYFESTPTAVEVGYQTIMKVAASTNSYSDYFGDVAEITFSSATQNPLTGLIATDIAVGGMNNSSGSPDFHDDAVNAVAASEDWHNETSLSDYEDATYGDIWVNLSTTLIDWSTAATPGTAAFEILLHELALSLGETEPASDSSVASEQYSVASTEAQPIAGFTIYVSGLQIDDILVMQDIYGPNFSTRNNPDSTDQGNTTYGTGHGFGASASDPFIYTIWDGGGNDTISAAGYTMGAHIDLREGAFSSIGLNNLGTAAQNNVAIAYHTVIENAIGTDQADVLIGNDWSNSLSGGGGNDAIFGNGTVYDGKAGFETAGWIGTDGIPVLYAQDPNMSVPTTDTDTLIGGDGDDILLAGEGHNQIVCGGNAVTTDGTITGSTVSGNDTYIIAMQTTDGVSSMDEATASIGFSYKTATVSNAANGELSTQLYGIENVVAQIYSGENEVGLSGAADLTGGMTVTDISPAAIDAYYTTLLTAMEADNIELGQYSPLRQIVTGETVSIGGTTVANFYNFNVFIGTSGNDQFNCDDGVTGRTVYGGGGDDTVNYGNTVFSGVYVTMVASETGLNGAATVQTIENNHSLSTTTDHLDGFTTLIGTSGNDTFDCQTLPGEDVTLEGSGGNDVFNFYVEAAHGGDATVIDNNGTATLNFTGVADEVQYVTARSAPDLNGDTMIVMTVVGEQTGDSVSIELDKTQIDRGSGPEIFVFDGQTFENSLVIDYLAAHEGEDISPFNLREHYTEGGGSSGSGTGISPTGGTNPVLNTDPTSEGAPSGGVGGVTIPNSAPDGTSNPTNGVHSSDGYGVYYNPVLTGEYWSYEVPPGDPYASAVAGMYTTDPTQIGALEAAGALAAPDGSGYIVSHFAYQSALLGVAMSANASDVTLQWTGGETDTLQVYVDNTAAFNVSAFTAGQTVTGMNYMSSADLSAITSGSSSYVVSNSGGLTNVAVSALGAVVLPDPPVEQTEYLQSLGFADGSALNLQGDLTFTALPDGSTLFARPDHNDTLQGLGGHDLMWGNNGNEVFIGGGGSDTMIGLTGDDTYVFAAGDSPTSSGGDTIQEAAGEGNDTIRFEASVNPADLVMSGLYINCGWGTGGFKAIPAGGTLLAHHLATGRAHDIAAPFNLKRFETGALIDEAAGAGIAH